jgi:hypothetical protein
MQDGDHGIQGESTIEQSTTFWLIVVSKVSDDPGCGRHVVVWVTTWVAFSSALGIVIVVVSISQGGNSAGCGKLS